MKEIDTDDLGAIAGGLNASECANAAVGGFGIGATVGGAVGAAAGAAGAAVGAVAGGLAGGAVAVSDNANCGTDGGGGGGGKVICTELCRMGVIDHDVWMADIRYSRQHFSERTMHGYHLWGIPFVRLMRKHEWLARIAAAPTRWFAEDIAFRMGIRSRPNRLGWALRELGFRPLCATLGLFAKSRDWRSLWTDGKAAG